jgi:hypothetical protein
MGPNGIKASRERLERAKQNTLVETNAQAIAETLRQLRAAPEIHRRRWIWELIQNAADACDSAKGINKVQIEAGPQKLTFRHDGAAFDEDELSHLIYHGSTKQADPTKKGKFGSGFITVHLVSEVVRVSGVLKQIDGTALNFSFNLDRRGGSAPEIQQHMEAAWRECLASMAPSGESQGYSTSFACAVDGHAQQTIAVGLAELEHAAPHVLALVSELGEIALDSADGRISWRKTGEQRDDAVSYLDVAKEANGVTETRRVAVIGNPAAFVALALVLHPSNGTWRIARETSVPRLFYPLPLVGTESLALPFAMVSGRFEPTEPRNGILAGGNVEDSLPTENNWKLLSEVPKLFERLAAEAVDRGWEDAYLLSAIGPTPSKEWLDDPKFNETVLLPLISFLRAPDGPKLLDTLSGKRAAFSELLLPVGDKAQAVHQLASRLTPIRERLPAERAVPDLSHIAANWATLLGESAEGLGESLTFESLGREAASRCSTLTELDTLVLPTEAPLRGIEWLNALFEQVPEQRLESLLRACALVPDQRGKLRNIGDLRMDGGIDDELKDICAEIGHDVRAELLDRRVSDKVKAQFLSVKGRMFSNEECLERALKTASQHVRDGNRTYVQGNAKLLRWMIEHQRSEKIIDYPVWANEGSRPLRKGDPVLLPKTLWGEDSRPFYDVFDPNRLLDDGYEAVLTERHWDALRAADVLRQAVLSSEEFDQLDSSQVEDAISEDVDHKPVVPVSIAQVLFLKGDEGILAQLRKSKARARRFIEFLLKYVIKAEPSWLEGVKAECSCGKTHGVRPAWLSLVRNNGWVPVGKGNGEKPTATNLAPLLDDPLRQHILLDEDSARFLLKLDIGLTDLLRVGVSEAKRFQLDQLSAKIYDSEDLTIASVEAVLGDSAIRDLVLEKKREKETVERNQNVGKLIEDLLRKELVSENIKVKRRPVGSDFELQSDFVEGGQEQLLELDPYIVEVKATSTPFVRMTLRQGIESCRQEIRQRYALCVVPLLQYPMDEAAVRKSARFVVGIGSHLEEKVQAAGDLKALEGTMAPEGGTVEIDMVESEIKFRISEVVWHDGETFDQFLSRFKRRGVEKAPSI